MRRLLPLAAVLALSAVVLRFAKASEDPPAGLAGLAWLEGHWRSGGEDAFDETWLPAGGGSMAAVSRLVHGGKANLYELSAIEETDAGLVLRIRHFGPGLEPWKSEAEATPTWALSKSAPNEVVFEDATRDFPRRISYRREAGSAGKPDALVARLEGSKDGKPREMEFRLTRVD
jgi:hypothetical protein